MQAHFFVVIAWCTLQSIATLPSQPFVDLSIGRVYGISKQSTNEYLGIQYANISQRWTRPQSFSNVSFPHNIYNATQFGPCCMQLGSEYSGAYISEPLAENCLYLNIYTPKPTTHQPKHHSHYTSKSNKKQFDGNNNLLPVLFWIYGGGDNYGCSSQALPHIYNGTNLIAHSSIYQNFNETSVIVVTINYRLDVLSKLYLPELIKEYSDEWPTSGNYNKLDIVAALHWVRDHIASFGGDPNKITVFGQSAGGNNGIDLGALTITKINNGDGIKNSNFDILNSIKTIHKQQEYNEEYLFNAVISESGDAFVSAGYSNTSTAIEKSYRFCDMIGCNRSLFTNTTDGDKQFLDCLRNANITTMMLINRNLTDWADATVIDNYIYESYPQNLMKLGKYNNIFIMIGNNYPDFVPFCASYPNADSDFLLEYLNYTLPLWGIPNHYLVIIYQMYNVYNCVTMDEAIVGTNLTVDDACCTVGTEIFLDYAMVCSARRILNTSYIYLNQRELYWYRFECVPTCPLNSYPVCQHTSEIAYVFGTVSNYVSDSVPDCDWDNSTRVFSNRVIDVWNKFANGIADTIMPKYVPGVGKLSQYYSVAPWLEHFEWKNFTHDDKCDLFDQIEHYLNVQKFGM